MVGRPPVQRIAGVQFPHAVPLVIWGCSSIGRASEWHSEGSRIVTDQLHHLWNTNRTGDAGHAWKALRAQKWVCVSITQYSATC